MSNINQQNDKKGNEHLSDGKTGIGSESLSEAVRRGIATDGKHDPNSNKKPVDPNRVNDEIRREQEKNKNLHEKQHNLSNPIDHEGVVDPNKEYLKK